MRKSIWSFTFGVFAISLALSGCRDETHPNVILISLDTLRADHLGCYGYSRPTSPFLDELAGRGTLFETALVQVPGTLPSHMSIFTGLYPNEHGVFPPDGALPSRIPTLPETLRSAGYTTAGFTEGGYVSGHYGFERGFDFFDDKVPQRCNDIELVFSRGLDFLQKQTPSRPFFLFLHSYAIHDPYFPPLPYTTLYTENLPPPSSFEDRFAFFRYPELPLVTQKREKGHERIQGATLAFIKDGLPPGVDLPTGSILYAKNRENTGEVSPEALAIYTALYDASINYADDVLRAFWGSLEKLQLLDNTIIVVTSDHGEEFLEHGKMTHGQIYQECLRVPLIILTPQDVGRRRIADIVRSIDLAPTIFDLTGVVAPARMTGVSLTPLMQGTGTWDRLESYARDAGNTNQSLHARDHRLLQAVLHLSEGKGLGDWHTRTAELATESSDIRFRAMSFYTNREVEVLVNDAHLTTLELTPKWEHFSLKVDGGPAKRTFLFRTPGCTAPAEIRDSDDHRCLSFRIADFPQERVELFDLSTDPTGTTDIMDADPEAGSDMTRRMKAYDVPPIVQGSTVDLSPEEIERLKALGYMQ